MNRITRGSIKNTRNGWKGIGTNVSQMATY